MQYQAARIQAEELPVAVIRQAVRLSVVQVAALVMTVAFGPNDRVDVK